MNAQPPSQGLIGQWVHTLAEVAQGVNAGVQLVRGGLEDERDKLIQSTVTTVLSVFLVAFGCLLAVAALMLALPEDWRAGTAIGAALVFWALGGWGLWHLRTQRQLRRKHMAAPPVH